MATTLTTIDMERWIRGGDVMTTAPRLRTSGPRCRRTTGTTELALAQAGLEQALICDRAASRARGAVQGRG